jgi:hypothetical protein
VGLLLLAVPEFGHAVEGSKVLTWTNI